MPCVAISNVGKQANHYLLVKNHQKEVNHINIDPTESVLSPITDVIKQLNEITTQLKVNLMVDRDNHKIMMDDLLSNSNNILRMEQRKW